MEHPPALRSKRGQNTAEYLIMLTLVAVGSIALVTVFGKTVQKKIAQVTLAISGDTSGKYADQQKGAVDAAATGDSRAKEDLNMQGIQASDLTSK
jgi:hypothetical protein